MITAYTMVDTAAGASRSVYEAAREVDGVVEAHVIAGDFDVLIELEGDSPHDILRIITSKIRTLDGVGTTRTYVSLDER